MSFTIGSLFDGSGGFPLAAFMCGGVPVWASEIEPYPIAVTKSRFPFMKHLGSVTDINGADVEPVDVISFGSPCQDLSVAGKRAGLKHENNGDEETTRSGLFMDAVRIIKEMREATNGVYPRFAVWENVPGAFSSNKGEDFKIVLEELIKIVAPRAVMPSVPRKGWSYADHYRGDGWSLAYRVFDAQYWGVPQRRRRIYLVLDLTGDRAGEILFERDGLRGYFTEGRTPWETTPADAERSVGTNDRERTQSNTVLVRGEDADCRGRIRDRQGSVGATVDSLNHSVCSFHLTQDPICGETVTSCLSTGNTVHGQASIGVVESFGFPLGFRPEITENGVCPTITAAAGMSGNNQPWICSAGFKEHNSADDRTIGYEKETSPTLSATNHDACVVYSIENHPADSRVDIDKSGIVQCLTSRMGTGGGNIPLVMEQLLTNKEPNAVSRPCCYRQGGFAEYIAGEVGTLRAAGGDFGGGSENLIRINYRVRRLTPTECARLQGFADQWALPDTKTEFSDEDYTFWLTVRNTYAAINGKAVKEYTRKQMLNWYNKLHTDSTEYKLWGNGIAFPCALYVMQGIADVFQTTIVQ